MNQRSTSDLCLEALQQAMNEGQPWQSEREIADRVTASNETRLGIVRCAWVMGILMLEERVDVGIFIRAKEAEPGIYEVWRDLQEIDTISLGDTWRFKYRLVDEDPTNGHRNKVKQPVKARKNIGLLGTALPQGA